MILQIHFHARIKVCGYSGMMAMEGFCCRNIQGTLGHGNFNSIDYINGITLLYLFLVCFIFIRNRKIILWQWTWVGGTEEGNEKKIERREIPIWIGGGTCWKVAETNKKVCLRLMFFKIPFNWYYQNWRKPYFKKCILLLYFF